MFGCWLQSPCSLTASYYCFPPLGHWDHGFRCMDICPHFLYLLTCQMPKYQQSCQIMTHAQDLTISYVNVNRFEWLHFWYINDRKLEDLVGGCNIFRCARPSCKVAVKIIWYDQSSVHILWVVAYVQTVILTGTTGMPLCSYMFSLMQAIFIVTPESGQIYLWVSVTVRFMPILKKTKAYLSLL